MDSLSEILKSVRLSGAAFVPVELRAPWGVRSTPLDGLGPLLAPGAGRVVIYHLVLEGRACVALDTGDRVVLEAGDAVIVPHGDAHALWHGRPSRWLDLLPDARRAFAGDHRSVRAVPGDGPITRLVCGYLACERSADHLYLSGLPPLLRIRLRGRAGGEWIEQAMHDLGTSGDEDGRAALMARLSEVVLVETLRRYAIELPPDRTGWVAGARDPIVGRALALLHREPGRQWSVPSLARETGAARSVLVARFHHFVGAPPMGYLTRWRLQLGARLLETTTRSIVEIAADVGYRSEASFNRAFKRRFRLPPGRYRRCARVDWPESAGACGLREPTPPVEAVVA